MKERILLFLAGFAAVMQETLGKGKLRNNKIDRYHSNCSKILKVKCEI